MIGTAALTVLCCAATTKANAQVYNVVVDTAGLNTGNYWAADFNLTPENSNTLDSSVTISDFNFGTGVDEGPAPGDTIGLVSGTAATGITLDTNNGAGGAEYGEDFSPGNQLSFTVDTTKLSGTDLFSFGVYDDGSGPYSGESGPTTAPNGYDLVDISAPDGATAYTYTSLVDGQQYNVTVTPTGIAAVPEAGTLVGTALMLSLLGLLMRPKVRMVPCKAK
jgi:hypothetical protein